MSYCITDICMKIAQMAKKMQHRFADAALLLPYRATSTISVYKAQNAYITQNYDTKSSELYIQP